MPPLLPTAEPQPTPLPLPPASSPEDSAAAIEAARLQWQLKHSNMRSHLRWLPVTQFGGQQMNLADAFSVPAKWLSQYMCGKDARGSLHGVRLIVHRSLAIALEASDLGAFLLQFWWSCGAFFEGDTCRFCFSKDSSYHKGLASTPGPPTRCRIGCYI